jgi:hypothetical protein
VNVDKLALYDNVKGVFADLDDGGLTEREALKMIRDMVNPSGTWKIGCYVEFIATVIANNETDAIDLGRDATRAAVAKIKDHFEDENNIDITGLALGTILVERTA